jgi:bifunctional non-homologous end joining protein LigD
MAPRKVSASAASRAVDRQLERYRSMRDFKATAEPRGGGRSGPAEKKSNRLPFVVQKHAATRLHYDFRLGWDGVLKSWAVTKGPSFYPGDKRLAVQVEDHPIEYGGFEGTIPKGQYGGGAVMVWDFGDWEPDGDVDQGLKGGHLKFWLYGAKLKGKWALVRMHGGAEKTGKSNWLLVKEKDSLAKSQSDPPITEKEPNSALTQRTIEQIAENEDHIWNSSKTRNENAKATMRVKEESRGTEKNGRGISVERNLRTDDAPRESFPGFIPPQLAQLAAKAPSGGEWLHELKLDGYRIQILVRSSARRNETRRESTMLTRKGLDWTRRMPDIARAAAQLQVKNAILDGEVVALDEGGRTSFADLQAAFQEGTPTYLTYFAFDLLHLDGRNLRELGLDERKEILADLLGRSGDVGPISMSEHLRADGEEVFAKACSLDAEGVVSKLASGKYKSGRSGAWLKIKCIQEQEFVIGGFTFPSKGGVGIGALLLGYYEGKKLIYAGRSGTGFSKSIQRSLRTQLDALSQNRSAFASIPNAAIRGAHWVRPELVAQISFATWTRDNIVRQAAFKGLREDKSATEVVREAIERRDGKGPVKGQSRAKPDGVRGRMPRSTSGAKESDGMIDLRITHPDKVLDEESGMTKRMLAEYYVGVAEHMLPHIADRPLSVVRCPEGSGKPCFYQKHVGLGIPKGVESIAIANRKTGKKEEFLTLNSAEGLIGLAQMGVLEIHPWGSRNKSLETPDRIVFDLDPDTAIEWNQLAECAFEVREQLKGRGLTSFVKSTGGKGLHIVVPIEPEHEWPVIKQFAHGVVLDMESGNPALYLTKMTKAARKNRIYLDYLRNDRESTAVAPWSPRARRGAPVAVPLDWRELKDESLASFHVSDFANWQRRLKSDPWKAMLTTKQRLRKSELKQN